MQQLPQQIKDVLERLHECGYPSAIVAGGAIRDWNFGKPIKDIDVFVASEDVEGYMHPVSSLADCLGRAVFKEDWSSYMSIPDIDGVYTVIPFPGELPVQIIVMKPGLSPAERVDLLDFGFCQAYYDGKEVSVSWAFFNDMHQKRITLVHCENQHEFDRSMVRYERLKLKYPEFQLVIPPRFRDYQHPLYAEKFLDHPDSFHKRNLPA